MDARQPLRALGLECRDVTLVAQRERDIVEPLEQVRLKEVGERE